MPRLPHLLATAALCLAASGPALAARIARVDVHGLDEAMTRNVRISLSLVDAIGEDLAARRVDYLLRVAEKQTREALQPFGYYSPRIRIERSDGQDGIRVLVDVAPGEPVRVRKEAVGIHGEGGSDRYLREDLAAFRPGSGEVFEHALYEAGKTRITRRLAERGYFDAELATHRVEVTRAEHAADIDLSWNSGPRYDMGPVQFVQQPERIIRDGLLEKLVYWDEGEYYHQGRLDRLRLSLARLDYFSRIDIQPMPEAAVDGRVPVAVTLTPAKRSIYSGGLSYGTDSGFGVSLGVERRYLNSRGHKALGQLDYAQKRKALTLQYRIPAFAWLDGWYTIALQAVDEQSDYIDDRRIELVASRSGEINKYLTATASVHALRERWAFLPADDGDGAPAPLDYRYASFVYPELRADYVDVDNRAFPRRGLGGALTLRGGLSTTGSDANFAQFHARASWFHGFDDRNRLILRGEIGHIFTESPLDLPPSLRFYAGGDRSIRGYAYREVGPRIEVAGGNFYATGARSLVTTSVEFEHYFNDTLGMAVFVDSGDAFVGRSPDWRTGVGIGLRYRTPVGPLQLDIARGLDHPDAPFTIGLGIGAEF